VIKTYLRLCVQEFLKVFR